MVTWALPRRWSGAARCSRMLSRLQELRREEETLLRVKAALHEQLTRLKVEELALQSMIRSRDEDVAAAPGGGDPQQILGQMDNEAAINQTELQLSIRDYEEVEEEEESDS